MDKFDIAELAYRNGYENGKRDIARWIPATERKPTKEDAKVIDGYVIAILKGRKPNLIKWYEVAAYPHYFTHWMFIPPTPKGE